MLRATYLAMCQRIDLPLRNCIACSSQKGCECSTDSSASKTMACSLAQGSKFLLGTVQQEMLLWKVSSYQQDFTWTEISVNSTLFTLTPNLEL